MATSGSTNFNLTRDDIIDLALELLQVKAAGETADSNDVSTLSNVLNAMIKHWHSYGILSDKRRVGYVFLSKGTDVYSLGSAAGDAHSSDEFITTNLNGALAASATAVTVDSTSNMAASDTILFTKDDGTYDSDTISSVDTTTTLTLTTGVSEAISDNARVFAYTSKIERPVKVYEARRRDLTTSSTTYTDTPTNILSHDEYWDLSSKNQNSRFTSLMYDRQRSSGKLYVWPGVDSTDSVAIITYTTPVEDFDASTDDADFTQEWLLPLAYNLAAEAAPMFGITGQMLNEISLRAEKQLWDVLGHDADDTSIFFQPWDRN